MSALARWAYSFFTATEVKVDKIATRELYCGEKTLFCSIVLTDSKGKPAFTNYHRNEIKVFSEHGSVYNAEFELCINDDDQGRLDVYCVAATRAGRAQVKLDLGKWYTFVGQSEFPLVFQPSCPAKLKVTRCRGDQYVGGIVELQLASFDRFNNKAIACKHEIGISSDPRAAVSLLDSDICDGEYSIRLQLRLKCRVYVYIQVHFTGRRKNERRRRCPDVSFDRCIKGLSLNISHPPMSPAKSFCRIISPSDHIPIAGSPLKIEVEINDVFGEPIHPELMPTIFASQNNDKVLQSRICVPSTNSHNKKFLEIIETRAGSQLVRILLNGRIIPKWDFKVHVVASRPKYLRSLKAVCHPKDSKFKPVGNTLYYGAWSTLEADITDEYGNVAKQITDTEHYEVSLEAFDNKGSRVALEWKNAKINNGKISVEVQSKQVGQQQLVVRLSEKRNPNEGLASATTTINVRDSPCSASLTQVKFNDTKCTAGSEYTFQVNIHDVFGNAVRPQSELRCDIDAHILPQVLKHSEKQRREYIKKERDLTSPTLNFIVAVGLKLGGSRNVKVVVNSDMSNPKIIPVEVLPSNPHHLNGIRFVVKTSEDPNFTPDPEVLYDNQWSTLEASIVDEYGNVVMHFDGNENVRLESVEQGNKTDVAYKDAAIKDGVLRVEVKAKGVGQRDVLVILTDKNGSNDEFLLEKVQLDICHPPMSSAQSFLRKFSPSNFPPKAGSPFMIEIEINDVFGEPVHPEHMPSISASLNKVVQSRVRSTNSHNKKVLEITETRAGMHLVYILLNDRIIPKWDFNVHVVASGPKYLRSLKVICHPKDSAFKPAGNTLYYGAWSCLEASFFDEYGNFAKQITCTEHCDVRLEAFDNKGSRVLLEWKNAKINNGKICVEVQPKQVGQQQLVVRLSEKRNPNEGLASATTTINVRDSPCSALLTQVKFNDTKCTAGSEYTFQVNIHDVFGNAVRQQSELRCNIDAQIVPQVLKYPEKQRGECIKKERDLTSAALSFTVAVGLKLAGSRNVNVVVNSDMSNPKIIPVEVVPSNPHHLNGIRFVVKTPEDPNFTPDPEVLYDNQWSTLEASIVDEYGNVVTHFDGNENVRLESVEQGNKTDVAYKDAAIKDGVLRVEVKAKGVGQRDVLVILTDKNGSNDEFLLERVQLDICHPPMSSAQSFRRKFSPSNFPPKAGSPFMIEIEINDVFGEPVHPEHMPSISASLNKVVQSRVRSTNSHNKKLLEITETRAGSQLVRILLNGRIILKWDFNVHVVASRPKYLRSLKVVCHPKDSAFKPVGNTLYYGAWSTFEADITDEYGNVAKQISDTEHYDVSLEALDNKGSRVVLEWKNAKINNGKISVEVQPKQVGQQQLVVRLSEKRNPNEGLASVTTTIDVCDSPCSALLTQVKFNDTKCTAGSEYTFQVNIHDVFGNAVRPQSELRCNIDAQIVPQVLKYPEKQRGECIKKERHLTSSSLSFTVAVSLKLAGSRNVKVVVNSDMSNSKIIPVEVVPSNPHHLNGVRFIAKTSEDSNFIPDPEVLYDNQRSTLEASIVDEYENVVTRFDGNENIRLESAEQGNKTHVAYKVAAIKDGVFRANVKVKGVGQRDLLVILANKDRPNDEVLLEKLQRPVTDAPFSLHLSKISQLDTCVAGTQSKFEVLPFDVYGKAMTANSTAKCILSGKILDSPSPSKVNEECVMRENVEKSSNYCIGVTVVLTKAGERRLEIFDKDNKSKQICIKVKPDLDNVKCKQTTAKVTSVYTGELSRLTTVFTDRFGNEIPLDAARPPRFFQKSGPKKGLQTKSDPTAVVANTSSVDYQFLKQGTYVVSLQCPNLSGDYTDVEELSFDVQQAPLDPQQCTVTWSPEFDDLEDQPLFTEDEQFKCVVQLKDIHNNNYIIDDEESVDLSVTCGDIWVNIQEKTILGPGTLKATVPLINFKIHSGTATEFCFILNGYKIVEPLRLTFVGYLIYDDSQCQIVHHCDDISTRTSAIECKNVTKREIRGEDNCHLENIRRICNLKDSGRTEVKEISCKALVILPQLYPTNEQEICRDTLLHLVRALYYRQQASEADEEREKWRDYAKESYDRLRSTNERGEKPTFCRKIKERYANCMRKYNREACEEIFIFYNLQRDQNEIDLHGLLVTDEKKLKQHEIQLEMKGKAKDEVKRIIEEEREEGDEAIRKLRQRLETFDKAKAKDDCKTWLEVIVGAGHHSKVRGRQKIRPKVEKYLNEETVGFSVVNKGALVVTFEDYLGTDRCFGEYYCQRCQKAWKSGKSWKEKYQVCQGCYAENKTIEKCYPLKQRPLEGGSRYKSWQIRYTTGSHSPEFCEKCIELDYPCYY